MDFILSQRWKQLYIYRFLTVNIRANVEKHYSYIKNKVHRAEKMK